MCIKVINEHLDLAINDWDNDRAHWIGKKRNAGEKPRSIVTKLGRYKERNNNCDSKKKLKGKKISIKEIRQGKSIILKIFGFQKEKFDTRMSQEKLRCIIVNTIEWLTDMC